MKSLKKLDYSKPLLITLILVLVIFFILFIINKRSSNNYSSLKKDTKKDIIYTYEESSRSRSYIPQINLFSLDALKINKEIIKDSREYLDSNTPNKSVIYNYNYYKDKLSVVLTYKDINDNGELEFSFKTYVLDLSNDGSVMSDSDILNLYDITKMGIDNLIKKKLYDVYQDEVSKGIIDSNECDYLCYLKLRGTNNFSENSNYYIENGHLVVYRSFNVYTKYKEEKYFTRDNFKFIVK